jgi:hypothetical protein
MTESRDLPQTLGGYLRPGWLTPVRHATMTLPGEAKPRYLALSYWEHHAQRVRWAAARIPLSKA